MILELVDAATLDADRGWWTIYDESFPLEEREPRDVILRSLHDGVGMALRARDGERTIGLATVHLLKHPPAVFLVYLGVDKSLRSRGVGLAVFDEIRRLAWPRVAGAIATVWECDIPALADSPTERTRRDKRISFFERCGGRCLPRPYCQPPLHADSPVPMQLMARSETALEDETTERLVRAIYFEKYGAVNRISRAVLDQLLR